ncbi:DNA recombination protein RmuC [Marinicaulis aureus]|uniref:DNA recombination protein RmuC homolog n=1 Tax=Hyphococcus aureus TaxID=2666033 RepID=A0ABW1KS30_9PROT
MQTLSPSVQNQAEGIESVGETAQTETQTPAPLISGPAPALWAGVGAFLLIFIIGMMLIIRGRVTRPAKRRAEVAGTTYFEPAGEDADITFDDDDSLHADAKTADPDDARWRDEEVGDTEVIIERSDAQEAESTEAHHEEEVEPLFDEPLDKPQKKKSAFAGLFSKKQPQEVASEPESEPFYDEEEEEGFFAAAKEHTAEPVAQPIRHEAPSSVDTERLAHAEEAAQAALKRAEEAEALARDLKLANEEAQNVMNIGLRKREAALDERASALIAMEKRLAALADEFQQRGEAEARAAQLSPGQAAAFHDAPTGVSEAHFAEFADLMGEQFDALRGAVNAAIEKLSRRIDTLPVAQSAAATATAARVQLSDLLGDALAPGRFKLAQKLSTGRTADALIIMPGPMAPIAVDARFPTEAFDAWQLSRNAGTETELRRAILRHIADGAEKLISPEETTDCAMMFVPSENILSELHAHFSDLVQESYRARVWMVSPTSLMATLHTISAVMAGAGIKEMSSVNMVDELHDLRSRVATLESQRKNGSTSTHAEKPAPKPETSYKPAEYSDVFENVPHEAGGEDKPPFPLR